jgi:hypothetical protein
LGKRNYDVISQCRDGCGTYPYRKKNGSHITRALGALSIAVRDVMMMVPGEVAVMLEMVMVPDMSGLRIRRRSEAHEA